eukprot:SAG31_NODE_1980_length_6748_cov_2.881336_4_plen_134_part_00
MARRGEAVARGRGPGGGWGSRRGGGGRGGGGGRVMDGPNLDDIFRRMHVQPGYLGMIVINQMGIPIRTTFADQKQTAQLAALISSMVTMGISAIADLDKSNALTMLRLRSQKYEMIISCDPSFTLCVFQDAKN